MLFSPHTVTTSSLGKHARKNPESSNKYFSADNEKCAYSKKIL